MRAAQRTLGAPTYPSPDKFTLLALEKFSRVRLAAHEGLLVLASPQPAVARLLCAAGVSKTLAVCDSVQPARGALVARSAAPHDG